MSMYDNAEKDDIYAEIVRFLIDHPISELLEIVTDAVNAMEVDE